jgi:hypothetical protein
MLDILVGLGLSSKELFDPFRGDRSHLSIIVKPSPFMISGP